MGEREGRKLGCLEMALIFQPGSSLHDARGVRQAVVVLHVKRCHVLHGSRAESAAKQGRESSERCARNSTGWKGFGSVYGAQLYMPHSDFWSKPVS